MNASCTHPYAPHKQRTSTDKKDGKKNQQKFRKVHVIDFYFSINLWKAISSFFFPSLPSSSPLACLSNPTPSPLLEPISRDTGKKVGHTHVLHVVPTHAQGAFKRFQRNVLSCSKLFCPVFFPQEHDNAKEDLESQIPWGL